MKDSELAKLWRGYTKRKVDWLCGHCSAVVADPEQHTRWHNDLRDMLRLIVEVS